MLSGDRSSQPKADVWWQHWESFLHHTTRWFLINDKQVCVDAGQKRKRLSSSWRSIWKPVSSLYDKVSHVSQLVQRVHRLSENSGPPWSTSFLCVETLSSTRHSTLDAILIQNYANKWPCILWLRLPIFFFFSNLSGHSHTSLLEPSQWIFSHLKFGSLFVKQGHEWSCQVWPRCMICKGNHVVRFVFLSISEEAKTKQWFLWYQE